MTNVSKRKSANYQVCYSPKKVNLLKLKSINCAALPKTKRITPYRPNAPPQPIPSYLSKEKANSIRNNSNSNSPQINDDYFVEMRNQLIDEGIYVKDIEYKDLPNLSENLREYVATKSYERDYNAAKEAREIYDQVKAKMLYLQKYNVQSDSASTDSNAQLLENKKNEQKNELEQFDSKTDEKLRELIEKHSEAKEIFEKRWKDDLPQMYRKQSSKLIQLFQMEKTLGLLNEFDKANQIKEEADKLEETEIESAQCQMESDYDQQRSTFESNQKKELQNVREIRMAQRDCLLAKHKEELKKVENRINVLNDHQRQIKRPKESSFEIQARQPVNTNLINIIRGGTGNEQNSSRSQMAKLLPPLIPPNDDRVKQRKKRERRERLEKNRIFKEKMSAKENDYTNNDRSETNSPTENCFDEMITKLDILIPSKKSAQKKSVPQKVGNQRKEIQNNDEFDCRGTHEASDLINSMIEKIDSQRDTLSVKTSDESDSVEIKIEKREEIDDGPNDGGEVKDVDNTFNLTQSSNFRANKD